MKTNLWIIWWIYLIIFIKKCYIKIVSGDTLWTISKKTGMPVEYLKSINNLTSNLLSIGQVLNLTSSPLYVEYIVKIGDTLYNIAKNSNTSVDNLKVLNNLNSNTLKVGQKLMLPTSEKNKSEMVDNNLYEVKRGDTLYAIANLYKVSVNEIKMLNNLTNDTLTIGQKLII